jgi:hypothetical protein
MHNLECFLCVIMSVAELKRDGVPMDRS